jgi:hypothetical protein
MSGYVRERRSSQFSEGNLLVPADQSVSLCQYLVCYSVISIVLCFDTEFQLLFSSKCINLDIIDKKTKGIPFSIIILVAVIVGDEA